MSEERFVPPEYLQIHDMWTCVRRTLINSVIDYTINDMGLKNLPDFESKWKDIPDEKMDEWHDFIFGHAIEIWKPYPEFNEVFIGNSTAELIGDRLYELYRVIHDFLVKKVFEIWSKEDIYKRREINEKIE